MGKKDELQRIGTGNTAEIFIDNSNRVIKLFNAGCSQEDVWREYQNHRLVRKLVNNVPKVFDCVQKDGRFGYIMENVPGKSLASFMLEKKTFNEAMNVFVSTHKAWLSKTSKSAILYSEWMLKLIGEKIKDYDLIDKIKQLPEDNTLCHGDFHPYNVIITPEHKPVVIDFANICRGPREYDIARTYFLLKEAGIEMPIAEMYLEKMQVEYKEIQVYYEILKLLRKYEI